MPEPNPFRKLFTRRALLKSLQYVPVAWLPAPIRAFGIAAANSARVFPLADFRITPHYPAHSPLDEIIQLVPPGTDRFISERYAFEIGEILRSWANDLQQQNPPIERLGSFCDETLRASSLPTVTESPVRSHYGVTVTKRTYASAPILSRDKFLDELRTYLVSLSVLKTAAFQITAIRQTGVSPVRVSADIRYTLIGENPGGAREQRIGTWKTEWLENAAAGWRVVQWTADDETVSRAKSPLFVDITTQAFGKLASYKDQLLRGADYWRTVLDGASGIDVYGNQGIAVGDFDGDGFDDVYVCQPSGLPNRLYRNRGDGTFEDVTQRAGLDVLDATSCALFADFENRGHQDLLVVTSGGPLLFANDGADKFKLKEHAFNFARPPQGTFTHAALADYDHDGRLDVYFCLYNYYAGLDQYRYPSPYFDARNGPPNFLFHNEGGWNFTDRTEAAGLNVDNNRYSFACAWGDRNGNGWSDLYVANDFGRSNLYRNNSDGTFSSVSTEAAVEDVGAGMSACWLDFDGDGNQDIYVANMWSAAGLRVSTQDNFHAGDAGDVLAMYRRHARGNSFYRNLGNGGFANVAAENGTEYGGWAWSSDSWDFDHDGHPDIYVANGYISGSKESEVSSFFWRQVVGNSPAILSPAPKYEQGWNAINELIRSDRSWSGYERNVFYSNNGDGTFSDISGLTGIDFPEDSRAFALADLDHDGRLEVLLKNRNAPQLRLLRNSMPEIGTSIVFRLRGTKSNRDAIGAAVTLEASGHAQTKYVRAGSGFLSQHSKELSFGVADTKEFLKATIRWPSGTVQSMEKLPVNHRIEATEGSSDWRSTAFLPALPVQPGHAIGREALPELVETWLLQPLRAPGISLPDTSGQIWDLHSIQGNKLLIFWSSMSRESRSQLHSFAKLRLPTLQVLAVNVDDQPSKVAIRSVATTENLPFPLLTASSEVAGIYNIVFRYLFDRHRDLGVPTSFLIDGGGMIVKIYQGVVEAETVAQDVERIPRNPNNRMKMALPFPGTLHLGSFQRNDFTYGVAFFQRGYLGAATESFKQVITSKPDDAEANYNLGTLYLRQHDVSSARPYLEKAVQLKPAHAEAWNNLGMIAAEEGHTDEAVQDFQHCLRYRPDFVVALLNLGNLYRRQKLFANAEQLLNNAIQAEPENPEANYSLGMLYAQRNETVKAEQNFQNALKVRPEYADALNNYGVLLVREQHYAEAEQKFWSCIQANPKFDQAYLNLARLYVLLNEKDKAREVLQELLRQQPEHQMAQQALKMLQ